MSGDLAAAALAGAALSAAHRLARAAAGVAGVGAGLGLPAADAGWTGVAADAFDAALADLRGDAARLADLAGGAAGVLRRHAGGLLEVAGREAAGLEAASVQVDERLRLLRADLDDVAAEVDERLRRLRADLDGVAAEATLLAHLTRDRIGSAAVAALGAAAADPGTDADAVHRWWITLPDAVQARLVAEHPDLVGGLAGLPVAVRSAANERLLAADLRRLDHLSGPLSVEQAREVMAIRATAEQLARVRDSVDPVTGVPRRAALLVYDPEFSAGEGRVALVVGDAAYADNLAFLVPGLDSDVGGDLAALTVGAVRLADAAARDAPGESTAVVAWMGYDAPELTNVASGTPALLGARLLSTDVVGVAATRGPVHLTLVGHSYGSTTAATAVRSGARAVDDLVLMGSPGAGAATAEEVLPGRHVYVAANSRDPVTWLGWFGPDPASADFGAVRVPAQAAEPGRGLSFDAHSRYLDAGSESLHSVSHVVVGDVSEISGAPSRTDGPWGLGEHDPESGRRGETYGFDERGRDVRTG